MIIFDLDGTLLNTAKDLEIALNYALRAHNFPEKTETETLALLGNGIDALVAGALPQGRQNPDFEPVFATFKTYYSAHLNDYTAPIPGHYSAVAGTAPARRQNGHRFQQI